MATLDELRLTQLLQPFEGPSGIATLNPLAFQYQNPQYPNSTQMFYQPRTDISPTQDFYQPNNLSPTQDFYEPSLFPPTSYGFINAPQSYYPSNDISPTQDFYQPREFVNAPQNYYQPDLTTLRGLDMNRFQGVSDMSVIDETTNDEQVDSLTGEKKGLAKIFDFLQQFSPMQMIGKGIGTFFNPKESDFYRPSTSGIRGYSPQQLNQMNALGGYYSEPARAERRDTNYRANRISKLMQRKAAGKKIDERNLANLMNKAGLGDVDSGAMIDNIRRSRNTGYGIGDTGKAATPSRNYTSSPGAMSGDMEYGEE